jgi:alkanesulfonate monooxygenase SsuD/methylene tetrahydromethanopterin reductase-like flavin-dependent oxidoreductase (luciferase family)
VPSVETALQLLAERPDALQVFTQRRRAIIGTPAAVRDEIEQVALEYGAQEVLVVTITHDHQARKRSYELLAQAFKTMA